MGAFQQHLDQRHSLKFADIRLCFKACYTYFILIG